jgi:hypothetical protein
LKSKALHRKSRVENGIRNKILGKVFSTRAEYKSRACMTKTDLEALNIGIDFWKKSIYNIIISKKRKKSEVLLRIEINFDARVKLLE